MTNIDNFKSFVRKKPILINHVRHGHMSWQNFSDLYALYGEDENIWKEYVNKEERVETKEKKLTTSNSNTISNIIEFAKNMDTNKVQEGITSIQKAISLFGDIMLKNKNDTSYTYTPRPVYRRFDD